VNDVVTIVWKELKEWWQTRGSLRSRLLSYLPMIFIFGVFLPLQEREAWVESPLAGIFSLILPFILAGGAVADSFAGERERHTLETLLATRLSDRDIFLGKVLATVIYSTSVVWASMLVSLIALNVTRGAGPLFVYSGPILAMITVGCILTGLLTAAIGVFVSLRAPTVRAAAQVFSLVTLVVFVGGPFLLQALPNSIKFSIIQVLSTTNFTVVGIVAAVAVLALDVALLAMGIARFQRTRLILE
jgi:ABC-2 type transport system permease protein